MNDLQLQLRIAELEKEWARSLEATDIAVNGARSATFELSRVRKELERVKALAAERLQRLDDMAGRVDSMLKQRDATWLGQLDAERARAEKLKEHISKLLHNCVCGDGGNVEVCDMCKAAEADIAVTEVKP